MSEKSPSEILRSDEHVRKAGELVVGQFKYLAGLCWAPIIVVLAFFRGGDSEFGLLGKILVSVPLVALMIAGAIFFLAFQKQTLMVVHSLMGDEAIDKAEKKNPEARKQIETNMYFAWWLGHIANAIAFPLMMMSYVLLAIAAVVAVWV